ncbi:MAG: amidohydrolase 2 [Chloroflexi bacterium]|jgi:L-fuconolactonase|nr:amidohydrolase 2 [Chloroflexota bacterium]
MPVLDLPVIDTHVHLWDPALFKLSWTEDKPVLTRPYKLPEFNEASREIEVEGFVFIEAAVDPQYSFLEVAWVGNLARLEPRLKGIVAMAPLEHGKRVRHYLERLLDSGPLIKGIRRLIQGEPDPNFCLQPDFIEALRLLPDFGLSFDICIYHNQLPAAIEMVKQCPGNEFILDHIAKPAIKSGELSPWQENMAQLAQLPNVVCKISGLVTEADQENWTEDNLAPYVSHVLEVFGEDRVMFGSDWPVALLASPYTRWIETLDRLTSHLSVEARRKLWAGNARRVYRL